MPQATDALRDLMKMMFGDAISDGPPCKYLEDRGWKITPGFQWIMPHPDHYVDEKEELCLRFLMDEWDFGWIYKPKTPEFMDKSG